MKIKPFLFVYMIITGICLTGNNLFSKELDPPIQSYEVYKVSQQAESLPIFSNIIIEQLESQVDHRIATYKDIVNNIANNPNIVLSWEQLIQPIEDASCNLEQIVNLISHLNSVKDSPQLRTVYTKVLPKLSDLSAEFLQNKLLRQKILKLKNSDVFIKLNVAQKKIIENILLDFKLAGVDLSKHQKLRYKNITAMLSELSNKFSQNILDATQSWSYYINIENKQQIEGLPKHFVELAGKTAIQQGFKEGWLLTLDAPCVDVIMRHAKDRFLRQTIYKAYVTKASEIFEESFNNRQVISRLTKEEIINLNNKDIMQEIVKLRSELALLLGFENYSEYSLAHKMAKSTKEVVDFLNDLALHSVPFAKKEFADLMLFAQSIDQLDMLQPWDIGFYAERYKEQKFNLSEEELRNYLQLKHVLLGIFKLANSLYGINIEEVTKFDTWDPAINLYKVTDKLGDLRGYFYTDLYVRENKQSGAWMANCLSRHQKSDGTLQHPIAFLVTNFTKPTDDTVLLYHQELITLLHEFGHVLHHILTKANYVSVSGCNGVAWDAVELPSQFMEKWGYDWQFLQSVSLHKDSSIDNPKRISKELFNSLNHIKNYQAGMFMVRQLEFGIFDFNLHMWKPILLSSIPDIQQKLDQARKKVTVVPVAPFNRFQNTFSHIFAGGYAAGYYSYNWAEVLASDAFLAFKGLDLDKDLLTISKLGASFLENILEMGGSKDAMDLYVAFRGKRPSIRSLLEYKGLLTQEELMKDSNDPQ